MGSKTVMDKIFLKDHHGRVFNNLRVSLLDACNFSCVYCSPSKKISSKDFLSVEEIKNIVGHLVDLGVEKVRLTGGEPTLRKDLEEILAALSTLNIKQLGITSHGAYIDRYIKSFKQAKLRHVNISLDSLNAKTFEKMTKANYFDKVVDNILRLREHNEFNVKINCVIMKGINSSEINDFIEFSKNHKIQVRFLELMQIGVANRFHKEYFYSQKEIMEHIASQHSMELVETPIDSTSRVYKLDNGAEIGLIASETLPFCSTCSRLRLTAKGELKICLFKEDGVSLKGLDKDQYKEVLAPLLKLKPMERIEKIDQMMYQIGG